MKGKEIEEIIKGLDSNIEKLEEASRITLKDTKELLIDLFGSLRDMWEQFKGIFEKFAEVEEIEKATEKGELYKKEVEHNKNPDLGSLYL